MVYTLKDKDLIFFNVFLNLWPFKSLKIEFLPFKMKANGYRDVEMAELHQYTRDFSIKFWVISPYKNTCQYTKYCTKTQDGAGGCI